MQKAFIAIVLALTLSCVASYSVSTASGAWAKSPVPIIDDSNLNFTNSSRQIALSTLTSLSDLNLLGYKAPTTDDCEKATGDLSCSYALSYKAITTKDLSSKTNSSYSFKAPKKATFLNGIAYNFLVSNDSSNIPQIKLAQTKLEGAAVLTEVIVTSNKAAGVTPVFIAGQAVSGKNVMYLIQYNQTINFSSVTIGGSAPGKEFTWIASTNATEFGLTWGEALSSNQAYASYKDGDSYKVAVLDFGSGTVIGANTISGFQKSMSCQPYATDKKLYGVWCTNSTEADKDSKLNTTFYVTSANNTLGSLFVVNNVTKSYAFSVQPYAGYIAVMHVNAANASAITIDKQIWDLSASKTVVNQTNVFTYDILQDDLDEVRIPAGGYYVALSNKNSTSNRTNVKLGQVLAGSYLTTVFGSLMTVVAGLFLF